MRGIFRGMATRRKKPWNAGLEIPGIGSRPESPAPKPLAGAIVAGHSTPGAPESEWECLRCERIREGLEPVVPDHAPRCDYRGTGRDPERRG